MLYVKPEDICRDNCTIDGEIREVPILHVDFVIFPFGLGCCGKPRVKVFPQNITRVTFEV